MQVPSLIDVKKVLMVVNLGLQFSFLKLASIKDLR